MHKNKIADLYSSGADLIFHYTMASSVSQDEKRLFCRNLRLEKMRKM